MRRKLKRSCFFVDTHHATKPLCGLGTFYFTRHKLGGWPSLAPILKQIPKRAPKFQTHTSDCNSTPPGTRAGQGRPFSSVLEMASLDCIVQKYHQPESKCIPRGMLEIVQEGRKELYGISQRNLAKSHS